LIKYFNQFDDNKIKGIIVKLGSKGSLYVYGFNQYKYCKVFTSDKKIVDTTGCGDC